MPDHAVSAHPAVQTQLDRLFAHGPGTDILGLERITALLARLGDPHLSLPPVLHVAGTNGKGSTCAFLRAALEAAGLSAHVYTSPHLVRFNERIRMAGRLIADEPLAALLGEVLDHAEGIGASFFEVTTAAAFLAFARTRADACIVEVGLGGRLDATNVVRPIVTGIAQLGVDHQSFLGDSSEGIAAEKAGIAKPGVPLVTMRYAPASAARVAAVAAVAGAPLLAEGDAWRFAVRDDGVIVSDPAGDVEAPLPALPGAHQAANLALAIAMLRAQHTLPVPAAALVAAATAARWPGRMQRLAPGPLVALLPHGGELWLDGGHNPAAVEAVAGIMRRWSDGRPLALVFAMLANKDAPGLLAPLAPLIGSLVAVPIPGHAHHAPAALAALAQRSGVQVAETAPDVATALRQIAARSAQSATPPRVLILGSLYLAGAVLAANDQLPD